MRRRISHDKLELEIWSGLKRENDEDMVIYMVHREDGKGYMAQHLPLFSALSASTSARSDL